MSDRRRPVLIQASGPSVVRPTGSQKKVCVKRIWPWEGGRVQSVIGPVGFISRIVNVYVVTWVTDWARTREASDDAGDIEDFPFHQLISRSTLFSQAIFSTTQAFQERKGIVLL